MPRRKRTIREVVNNAVTYRAEETRRIESQGLVHAVLYVYGGIPRTPRMLRLRCHTYDDVVLYADKVKATTKEISCLICLADVPPRPSASRS